MIGVLIAWYTLAAASRIEKAVDARTRDILRLSRLRLAAKRVSALEKTAREDAVDLVLEKAEDKVGELTSLLVSIRDDIDARDSLDAVVRVLRRHPVRIDGTFLTKLAEIKRSIQSKVEDRSWAIEGRDDVDGQ